MQIGGAEGRGLSFMFSGSPWSCRLCRVMGAPRRHVSGWGCAGVCSGRKPDGGLAPIMGGRTGRRHRDLDAANADAHQRTDLEQLETNGAAGGVGEFGAVESDTTR